MNAQYALILMLKILLPSWRLRCCIRNAIEVEGNGIDSGGKMGTWFPNGEKVGPQSQGVSKNSWNAGLTAAQRCLLRWPYECSETVLWRAGQIHRFYKLALMVQQVCEVNIYFGALSLVKQFSSEENCFVSDQNLPLTWPLPRCLVNVS